MRIRIVVLEAHKHRALCILSSSTPDVLGDAVWLSPHYHLQIWIGFQKDGTLCQLWVTVSRWWTNADTTSGISCVAGLAVRFACPNNKSVKLSAWIARYLDVYTQHAWGVRGWCRRGVNYKHASSWLCKSPVHITNQDRLDYFAEKQNVCRQKFPAPIFHEFDIGGSEMILSMFKMNLKFSAHVSVIVSWRSNTIRDITLYISVLTTLWSS